MEAAGKKKSRPTAILASLGLIALGVAALGYGLCQGALAPTTNDATIDADVVHVASAVGGRIIDIPIAESAYVAKGDLLFRIDPTPYQLVLNQTIADLALAQAALGTQRRVLSTQRSAASIARDQVSRANANLDLARRTVDRLRPLAAKGYVPALQLDQAQTARTDAEVALRAAREQQAAASQAVDTEAGAAATVEARRSAVAVSQRALADTVVRASHAGRVAGLSVSTGEMIAPSQTLFTLVNADEWFAVGNFRESELHAIAVGDCATVYSMIDRGRPMKGVVQGIGAGVLDTDRINLPRSVPYVERSLNWVKVAQRFPVRVRLLEPAQRLVRLGASAVIEVKHGAACG
jgi:multidrug efflux system membrane fusion protein